MFEEVLVAPMSDTTASREAGFGLGGVGRCFTMGRGEGGGGVLAVRPQQTDVQNFDHHIIFAVGKDCATFCQK